MVKICLECRIPRFNPWVRKKPWRRKWQPTLVFLPGKSHGQRSLVSYSPWGRRESEMTERLNNSNKILQRGAKAENMREGPTESCSVTIWP